MSARRWDAALDAAVPLKRKPHIRCDYCHARLFRGSLQAWGFYRFDPMRAIHTACWPIFVTDPEMSKAAKFPLRLVVRRVFKYEKWRYVVIPWQTIHDVIPHGEYVAHYQLVRVQTVKAPEVKE